MARSAIGVSVFALACVAEPTAVQHPPSVSVSVSPAAPRTDDVVFASWSTSDPDGDAVTTTVWWTVDGVEVARDVDRLDGRWFERDQTVAVHVVPSDGVFAGEVATAAVVVVDAPPSVIGAVIEPALDVTVVANCDFQGWSDPDRDPPAFRVRWFVNGDLAGDGLTLAAPAFARGDEVVCELTPTSGADGDSVVSPPVLVGNAPPTAPTALLTPEVPVWGYDDLHCTVDQVAVDPDGDPVTYAAVWSSPKHVRLEGVRTVEPGDTLPALLTNQAPSFTCSMTASDGEDTTQGPPVTVAPVPAGGNILFILADDLGRDKIGAYAEHPDPPPTPNVDQLAAEGVLFRNAYASPACSPTRANVLTGRYGRRTGIGKIIDGFTYNYALPDTEVGLPLVLAGSAWFSYESNLVGKWHLGTLLDGHGYPGHFGFTWHAGSPGNLGERSTIGLDGGYGYFEWERNENGVVAVTTEYATTSTTNDALERIAVLSEPWMLYVSYNAAHKPLHLPPDELHSFEDVFDASSSAYDKHKAMVESLDTEIGRLLEGIDPTVRAHTTVVFMGDNGTPDHAVTDPFDPLFAKGSVHEGGAGVPLIVTGPLVASPGSESAALVHAVDLYTTFATISGVDVTELSQTDLDGSLVPVVVDGQSLLPYLADPLRPGQRSTLYVEYFEPNGDGPFDEDLRALRDDRFKLVRTLDGDEYVETLFDLSLGPVETVDLLSAGPLDGDAQAAYDALSAEMDALEATLVYDVLEHPPELGLVEILPVGATTADLLTCDVAGRDPDGDTVTVSYRWAVDGVEIGVTTATLEPALFGAGATVACTATPNDGQQDGVALSATILIAG